MCPRRTCHVSSPCTKVKHWVNIHNILLSSPCTAYKNTGDGWRANTVAEITLSHRDGLLLTQGFVWHLGGLFYRVIKDELLWIIVQWKAALNAVLNNGVTSTATCSPFPGLHFCNITVTSTFYKLFMSAIPFTWVTFGNAQCPDSVSYTTVILYCNTPLVLRS